MADYQELIFTSARKLLAGEISPEQFLAFGTQWCRDQSDDTLDDATLDIHRADRCGFPEVVFGQGKSIESLLNIIERFLRTNPSVLVTRVHEAQAQACIQRFGNSSVSYSPVARTLRVGDSKTNLQIPPNNPSTSAGGHVCVVTAGTTDLPVAEEACETLIWMGVGQELIADVGVAGPHRLLANVPRFRRADAIVVVAGMEGALPSVVAGHVACPIFAVPTSVGYGTHLAGFAALLSMLNSCAANVAVVNIDAGFKAGYLAGLVARRTASARRTAEGNSA